MHKIPDQVGDDVIAGHRGSVIAGYRDDVIAGHRDDVIAGHRGSVIAGLTGNLKYKNSNIMIDYIKGTIEELGATEITLENNGIGYKILISLQTYESLNGMKEAKIYIHHYLREDEELYYGFAGKDERELFRLLIGVSGIGASTARMMLSSLTSEEIRNAILAEDINKIKSIKGIGLKSAQRLVLELKDKVSKGGGADNSTLFTPASNPAVDEATTALVLLGFTKANVTKAVSAVLKEKPNAGLEEIIKLALKRL